MANLSKLPNIGQALAEKLENAGISSYDDLADIGSVEAVLKIDEQDIPTCPYGFFSKSVSKIAHPVSTVAIKKLVEKLFEISAKTPATAGPDTWPIPKIKVI